MAKTIFSLFADSCATSCNKKSMNQGQSIYSYNKDLEICHFPVPSCEYVLLIFISLFPSLFFVIKKKTMYLKKKKVSSFMPYKRRGMQTQPSCIFKKEKSLGKMASTPPPLPRLKDATWGEGIWLWQTKYAL